MNSQKGGALVEVLISLLLLSVAQMALVKTIHNAHNSKQKLDTRKLILEQKLEESFHLHKTN